MPLEHQFPSNRRQNIDIRRFELVNENGA